MMADARYNDKISSTLNKNCGSFLSLVVTTAVTRARIKSPTTTARFPQYDEGGVVSKSRPCAPWKIEDSLVDKISSESSRCLLSKIVRSEKNLDKTLPAPPAAVKWQKRHEQNKSSEQLHQRKWSCKGYIPAHGQNDKHMQRTGRQVEDDGIFPGSNGAAILTNGQRPATWMMSLPKSPVLEVDADNIITIPCDEPHVCDESLLPPATALVLNDISDV